MTIRPATTADAKFIANSWFQSYRPHAPQAGFDVFSVGHRAHMAHLLVTGKVVVAAATEDPDTIIGWAAYTADGAALHYVYVKQPFRRLGVATALMLPGARWYTFKTPAGSKLAALNGLRYNPWAAINEPTT